MKHSVTHHIPTTGPSVASCPLRLPPKQLKIARHEFDKMLDLGIIRPSSSCWASPLHMVPKKTPPRGACRHTQDGHNHTFLGLVNFYHCLSCPRLCLHTTASPRPAVSSPKKDRPLAWTPEAISAFTHIKDALAEASLLCHPQLDAPTCILVDASDLAVGAVLQQQINSVWCPISYFSRKLRPAERQYSTFNRELLAIYLTICHFRHFV